MAQAIVVLVCIVLLLCGISQCIISQMGIHWLDLLFVVIIVWFLSMWSALLTAHRVIRLFVSYQTGPKYVDTVDNDAVGAKQNIGSGACMDTLISDIEKHCLNSWFPKISKDPNFTKQSKSIIQDILEKMLKAQTPTNSKLLIYNMLNIYLRHLKEFKRILARKETNEYINTSNYRYVHFCSASPEKFNYFVYHLTVNFLNRFTNWELRNSLPCHVVDSIVARKLVNQVLETCIDPKRLNYFIMKLCASQQSQSSDYAFVSLEDQLFGDECQNAIEDCEPDAVLATSPPALHSEAFMTASQCGQNSDLSVGKDGEKNSELIEEKETNIISEYVIVEKEEKVHLDNVAAKFETSSSLQHLDMPDGTFQQLRGKYNSAVSDVGTIRLLHDVKTSMKPISGATINTLQSFKDFHQTTLDNVVKPMSQVTTTALHKIGDLQDEAVDVVEGIIDFGKAGIRKGLLQFTTLQEHAVKSESFYNGGHVSRQIERTSPPSNENAETSALKFEEPHDKKLADDMKSINNSREEIKPPKFLPVISMNLLEPTDSPDPEYEEAADLASTIAKLRTLLQQKSSESSLSTPAVSPMPPDEFGTSPYEVENAVSYPDEDNGMMPSFYKFCAKTATGVLHNTLNTIKTALPGNTIEGEYLNTNNWTFLEADGSDGLLVHMNKLLSERKAFCTVDNAYEAIESLKESDEQVFPCVLQIEDDLDDFEMKIPISKLLMDIVCELLLETDSVLIQEPVMKLCLLLFGYTVEDRIIEKFNGYIRSWITTYRYAPSEQAGEALQLHLEDFVRIIIADIPGVAVHLVGEDNLKKGVDFFVSSLQFQKLNQDMILQFCELVCLSFAEDGND